MTNRIEYPERIFDASVKSSDILSDISGNALHSPTMVSINEAKAVTGLSYEALRKMCISGEIIHIKIGNRYLINLERLIAKLNGEA